MNQICRVNIKKDLNKLARDLMKRCLWGEYTVIVKFIAPPPSNSKKKVLEGFGRFEFEGVQNVQLLPTETQLTNF